MSPTGLTLSRMPSCAHGRSELIDFRDRLADGWYTSSQQKTNEHCLARSSRMHHCVLLLRFFAAGVTIHLRIHLRCTCITKFEVQSLIISSRGNIPHIRHMRMAVVWLCSCLASWLCIPLYRPLMHFFLDPGSVDLQTWTSSSISYCYSG